MMMSPGSPNNLPPAPAELTRSRLLNALYLTAVPFHPSKDLDWLRVEPAEPLKYPLQTFLQPLVDEEGGFRRSPREETALVVSGLVLVARWLREDCYRNWLEDKFGQAHLSESLLVAPLAEVYVQQLPEPDGLFRRFEKALITNLRDVDSRVIRVSDVLIVLPPLVKRLAEQLKAEGHIPYDPNYYQQVSGRVETPTQTT